jgi:hypothetical protein
VAGGAGCRQRGQHDGGRRSFAGVMRNRDSGIGFGSGLVQEIACMMGNSIRGLRRGIEDCRRRPAARGGAERRRGRAGAGSKRGEKGAACEDPYPTTVFRWRSFDDGKR